VKSVFKIYISSIIISFCLSSITLRAQILKDTATLSLLRKGIDFIYNCQFDQASGVYRKISQSYPGHPVTYLFKGIITYWENFPLLPTSPAQASYEADMRTCIELSEKKNNTDNAAEYLLADLSARGMLLLFYADNDLSMDVFPLATGTYQYIRRSFEYTSVYTDFYFFTGLYNYYREAYPEAHPIYKTLAFLFPKGDMARGLKEIEIAATNSIVLKAESYSFLSDIYLSFENDYQKASYYSKLLHELYPANLEYLGDHIKNLLLIKQYDEAERLMTQTGTKTTNSFYLAELTIFNGILQEKKYRDITQARQNYIKGIKDISLFGDYGNDIAAFAYFGLSRISDDKGDKPYKKIYRKMALKLADYKKIDFDQ
jgi:hypothetical protein